MRPPGPARAAATLTGGLGVASLAVGRLVGQPASWRLLLTGSAAWLVASVGLAAPTATLYALLVWLAGLGLLRRVVSLASPVAGVDPLLLVGPIALAVLALAAVRRGAFRGPTRLSRAVQILSALTLVGALNPLQGSLTAGVVGLLFMLVPLLAFWVGRECDDRTMTRALSLIAALAVPAALYGLGQVFRGFPPWDAAWIRSFGYTALNVRGVLRPFSTFSNAAEYAFFLGIALVVWLGFGLRPLRIPATALAVPLLAVAVFYEASRGIVVLLAVTVGLMAAARSRVPFGAGALVGVATVGVLLAVLPRWVPTTAGDQAGSGLVAHQLQGLARPLDPEESTLPGHIRLMGVGLGSALRNPIGYGPGAVSMAGSRFGGLVFGTEVDPSNAAVALGLPGLAAYLVALVEGFRRAYRLASRRRDALSLAALGILSVTFLQWLNGAQYAVAPLVWLALGWVDSSSGRGGPDPGEPGGPQEARLGARA